MDEDILRRKVQSASSGALRQVHAAALAQHLVTKTKIQQAIDAVRDELLGVLAVSSFSSQTCHSCHRPVTLVTGWVASPVGGHLNGGGRCSADPAPYPHCNC